MDPQESTAAIVPDEQPQEAAEAIETVGDDDIVVLARNPQEMAEAQKGLVAWTRRKLQSLKAELADAEENLAQSTKLKIRTEGWKRQVALAKNRIIFYGKVHAALEAGYCIVPNFPSMELIAVRTSKNRPPRGEKVTSWQPNPTLVKYEQLPVGDGKYVNPRPKTKSFVRKDETTGKNLTTSWNTDFQELDFPFKVVRPQILSNLGKALAQKIFDDIGVLPQVTRAPDPMIVGRIRRREAGYSEPTITFLIAWWIDSRTL